MTLSAAFRRAYELLAAGQEKYSCDALLQVCKDRAPGALLFYREHFTPAVDSPEHYWLRSTGMTDIECHEWRMTALAFAAAITKSEGI